MGEPELPSLWAFGDPEPWRRGRVILITLALFHGIGQALVFLIALFGGDLETALALAITLALWWLLFAFIWFGSHWLRWLLDGWTLLVGFACFIGGSVMTPPRKSLPARSTS